MMDDNTLFFRFLKECKSYMRFKKRFDKRTNGKFNLAMPTHYVCTAFIWDGFDISHWVTLDHNWEDFYLYFKSEEKDIKIGGIKR